MTVRFGACGFPSPLFDIICVGKLKTKTSMMSLCSSGGNDMTVPLLPASVSLCQLPGQKLNPDAQGRVSANRGSRASIESKSGTQENRVLGQGFSALFFSSGKLNRNPAATKKGRGQLKNSIFIKKDPSFNTRPQTPRPEMKRYQVKSQFLLWPYVCAFLFTSLLAQFEANLISYTVHPCTSYIDLYCL